MKRKTSERIIFDWWGSPLGRIYVIVAQKLLIHANPDYKTHCVMGGEAEGSIPWRASDYMQSHHPKFYDSVRVTCPHQDFEGVVHKLYDRMVKVAQGRKLGGSMESEHYAERRDPARPDEIAKADRIIRKLGKFHLS